MNVVALETWIRKRRKQQKVSGPVGGHDLRELQHDLWHPIEQPNGWSAIHWRCNQPKTVGLFITEIQKYIASLEKDGLDAHWHRVGGPLGLSNEVGQTTYNDGSRLSHGWTKSLCKNVNLATDLCLCWQLGRSIMTVEWGHVPADVRIPNEGEQQREAEDLD